MSSELVRVIRILEYTGPREWVEKTVEQSIHGTKRMPGGTIKAVTLGDFPEIYKRATRRKKNEQPDT